jgi:SAM-dependent methyltransferase
MERSGYVIRGGVEGRERLRILARVMQPTTRTLLERAGVRPGMACLDVGCGGGDVTFDIARLVGPAGRVVGIDMDATQIDLASHEATDAALGHVEFRVSQVGDSDGDSDFDVVYTRFVLTHLTDPAGALAWMLGRVRPGGCVVVEDVDFTGHFCHPESAAFRRYLELYTRVVRGNGADPDIGPRLPGMLLDSGCRGVKMNVVQPAGYDGEVKLIAAITMENILGAVLAEGVASQDELDQVVGELYAVARDGRTVMSLPRVVQAWGRRA